MKPIRCELCLQEGNHEVYFSNKNGTELPIFLCENHKEVKEINFPNKWLLKIIERRKN